MIMSSLNRIKPQYHHIHRLTLKIFLLDKYAISSNDFTRWQHLQTAYIRQDSEDKYGFRKKFNVTKVLPNINIFSCATKFHK